MLQRTGRPAGRTCSPVSARHVVAFKRLYVLWRSRQKLLRVIKGILKRISKYHDTALRCGSSMHAGHQESHRPGLVGVELPVVLMRASYVSSFHSSRPGLWSTGSVIGCAVAVRCSRVPARPLHSLPDYICRYCATPCWRHAIKTAH